MIVYGVKKGNKFMTDSGFSKNLNLDTVLSKTKKDLRNAAEDYDGEVVALELEIKEAKGQ
jgi:hypothetical protein